MSYTGEGRRLKSFSCTYSILENIQESEVNNIKEISKKEMNLLIAKGIIRNTSRGYVDKNGNDIGFYRTKGVARKRYVKDKFVNMLDKIK